MGEVPGEVKQIDWTEGRAGVGTGIQDGRTTAHIWGQEVLFCGVDLCTRTLSTSLTPTCSTLLPL